MMTRLAYGIGVLGLLGSAGYLFTYIARWQWNRALFTGFAFLAILAVMGFAATLQRLSRIEARLDGDGGTTARQDPEVVRTLQDTRPRRDHFRWLRETPEQSNVFITLLLGGGVIVSGVAWLVGRVAESTTTPAAEEGLASRLEPIAYPRRGLVPTERPGEDDGSLLLRGHGGTR